MQTKDLIAGVDYAVTGSRPSLGDRHPSRARYTGETTTIKGRYSFDRRRPVLLFVPLDRDGAKRATVPSDHGDAEHRALGLVAWRAADVASTWDEHLDRERLRKLAAEERERKQEERDKQARQFEHRLVEIGLARTVTSYSIKGIEVYWSELDSVIAMLEAGYAAGARHRDDEEEGAD